MSRGCGTTVLLLALAVVLLAGCRHRFESLSENAETDTGGDSTDGGTVGADASLADAAPLGPFSAPSLIAAVAYDGSKDDDPTLTGDLLEMYFESARPGGFGGDGDIWVSTRANPSDPWGPPSFVPELSSDYDDETPEISADGLTLFLSSRRPGADGESNFWMATRADRGTPWSDPVPVPELNSPEREGAPALAASGLRLVFHSNRDDPQGEFDLFETSRASVSDPWATPEPIVELNTDALDATPYLSANGLQIWYASRRSESMGGTDLFTASRSSLAEPFAEPEQVSELNTSDHSEDPWISQDCRYIVFADNRTGDYELYEAWR